MATVCALHLFQDSQKKAAHNLDQVEAGRLRDPILLGSGSRSASEQSTKIYSGNSQIYDVMKMYNGTKMTFELNSQCCC